jgi:hypothetical protein
MDLIALQGWLDNASFAVLFATMLLYWCGVAFPKASLSAPASGTAGDGRGQPHHCGPAGSPAG